jgi:hypothetical protein
LSKVIRSVDIHGVDAPARVATCMWQSAMNLGFAKSTLSLTRPRSGGAGEVPSTDTGRVVSWSGDGLLASEYCLFAPSDLVLRTSDATSVRESGYRTTARRALEQLARSGVTPALADDAVRALPRKIVTSLARCEAARSAANRLGAAELLDGARFDTSTGAYKGAWLDLERLSRSLDVPAASMLLQALYLAATLAEVPGSTPVFLSTSEALEGRQADERTYRRPSLPSVDDLLEAVRGLPMEAGCETTQESSSLEARFRPALLARVRERMHADAPPAVRAHLDALELALAGPAPAPSVADGTSPASPERGRMMMVLRAPSLPSLDRLGGIVSSELDRRPRPNRYVPELVESLALPEGARESDLGDYDLPTTPQEVRIAMTRLARHLAREYRLRHGKVLRCDVLAIETMQQRLLGLGGASIHDREVGWQLRRHGALLSEIFARVLGGEWVDVSNKEAAYWMMRVGRDVRTRPIGCVFQFVAAGSSAVDLVGHFMELKKRGCE